MPKFYGDCVSLNIGLDHADALRTGVDSLWLSYQLTRQL